MNTIFVIYEEVPENTRFYLLHNVSDEVLKRLSRCHGHLINQSGNSKELDQDLDWMYSYLEDKQEIILESGKPIILSDKGDPVHVIHTGFIL